MGCQRILFQTSVSQTSINIFLLVCLLELSQFAFGQIDKTNSSHPTITKSVIDILFDLNGEAVTSKDLKDFESIQQIGKKNCYSPFLLKFKNIEGQFLLIKLASQEALELEIEADKSDLSRYIEDLRGHQTLALHSDKLVSVIKSYCQASQLLKIKEKNLQNDEALNAWLNVLKRKFSVSIKSNEFNQSLK